MAEALRSIHGAGIVHRDLKPANVLLTADGPRLIDFGIARAVDAVTITRPGFRTGSPGFMSPEQVAGDAIGPASDVFSFGATLLFARTGAEPFGDGPWHVKMSRIQAETPRLEEVAEDDLRALIASCMAQDPDRRPSADRLIDRITALRHTDPAGRTRCRLRSSPRSSGGPGRRRTRRSPATALPRGRYAATAGPRGPESVPVPVPS